MSSQVTNVVHKLLSTSQENEIMLLVVTGSMKKYIAPLQSRCSAVILAHTHRNTVYITLNPPIYVQQVYTFVWTLSIGRHHAQTQAGYILLFYQFNLP